MKDLKLDNVFTLRKNMEYIYTALNVKAEGIILRIVVMEPLFLFFL